MLSFIEYMPETLSEFVSRVMDEKNLSSYDVERISKRAITHSYVNRLKNGVAKNPSTDKLKGLAIGLGVIEDEVFSAARGQKATKKSAKDIETLQIIEGVEIQLDRSLKLSAKGKEKILDAVRYIAAGVIDSENNE